MRVTMDKAREFARKCGVGMLAVTAFKYLELADGDENLARMISDYYHGDGMEKPYTVGEIIKDYWQMKAREEHA